MSQSARTVFRNCEINSPESAAVSKAFYVLATAAFFGFQGPLRAQETAAKPETKAANSKSLATATWDEGEESPAICVKEDGWYICVIPSAVATSAATVRKGLKITIDGEVREGEILASDELSGLCLARTEVSDEGESHKPTAFSGVKDLLAGSEVIPMGQGRALVAGKDREYRGERLPFSMLRVQLDSPAREKSGQPLFDPEGNVAGILTDRVLQNENEAHAIPASRISKFVEDFESNQRTGAIRIGATFHTQSTTPEIVKIRPDSPAEKAGLQQGDIVLKVGGESVDSFSELVTVCESLPASRAVTIEVLRKLQRVECELIPELIPEEPNGVE